MKTEIGTITLVAGSDALDELGDGGPATQAALLRPVALCLDRSNNLYISDYDSFSIRRINAKTQTISTSAGGLHDIPEDFQEIPVDWDPLEQPLPDGANSLFGSLCAFSIQVLDSILFLSLPEEHKIRLIDLRTSRIQSLVGTGQPGFGGDSGPAQLAQLDQPAGLCLDATGQLFIADSGNDRVRQVDLQTSKITTLIGGGQQEPKVGQHLPAQQAHLLRPQHIALDAVGSLLVGTDAGVYRYDFRTGLLRVFEQDELSTCVEAITCDSHGNLFFTHSLSNCVSLLRPAANAVEPIIGSGCFSLEHQCLESCIEPDVLDLVSPKGLTAKDGVLYFTDLGLRRAFQYVYADTI